jgi:hypothetical protein
MTSELAAAYAERYSRLYGIDRNYLQVIFAADVTKVYRCGKKISFIFVYDESERDKIPPQLYTSEVTECQEVRMLAQVVDGCASWLYPRKYIVEQQSGASFQIWSHHWLRDPVAPAGIFVEIVGRDLGHGIISLTDLGHHIVPLSKPAP